LPLAAVKRKTAVYKKHTVVIEAVAKKKKPIFRRSLLRVGFFKIDLSTQEEANLV